MTDIKLKKEISLDELEALADIMTGGHTEDIRAACKMWDSERQALAELFDENQAQTISFRRYDLTMELAEKLITALELEAGMFIKQKTRDKIEQFREQMKKLETRRAADRQNVVDANERRNKPAPIEDFVRDLKKNLESDDE